MKPLNKSQKQLIMLGVILATIVVVLAIYVFKPPPTAQEAFTPPSVNTRINKAILSVPEFRRLSSPIPTPPGYSSGTGTAATSGDVPLVPGQMGRDNPFLPY